MFRKTIVVTLAASLLMAAPAMGVARWPFKGKNGGREIARNVATQQMTGVLGNYTNVNIVRITRADPQPAGPFVLVVNWAGTRERVDNGQVQLCRGHVWIDVHGLPIKSPFKCRPFRTVLA